MRFSVSENARRWSDHYSNGHRRHYYREIRRFRLGSHRYWSHREVRCSSGAQEQCIRRHAVRCRRARFAAECTSLAASCNSRPNLRAASRSAASY